MKKQLKVCGLTRVEDARLVLSLAADYCGIIAYEKSARYLGFDAMQELLDVIPAGKRVYVDVKPSIEKLAKAQDLGFDYFQLHFPADLELERLDAWSSCVGTDRLWLAPKASEAESFRVEWFNYSKHFLVDAIHSSQYGGTGQSNNWLRYKEWKALGSDQTFMLAGGLGPDNILDALKQTDADGFDFNSGVEQSPGIKDAKKLKALFEQL